MISKLEVSRCEFTPTCLPKQLSPGTGETNLVVGEVKCSPGRICVYQWLPGSGKLARGDTKMPPGRVSPGVLQRGVIIGVNTGNLIDFGVKNVIFRICMNAEKNGAKPSNHYC